MGSNSQLSCELDSQLGLQPHPPVDGKTAKKAIAKSAKFLRGLLTNQKDMLIQHGLLEHKDTEDVVKGLQENIGQHPSLLWVLISQISGIPEGEEAARRLQGELGIQRLSCRSHAILSPFTYFSL